MFWTALSGGAKTTLIFLSSDEPVYLLANTRFDNQ
jgi:hypothetical protein